MIQSHLVALLLFSALVSIVFATLLRDDMKSRLRFGLMAFGAFVLSAVVVGWIMYPFPELMPRPAALWAPVIAWMVLIFGFSSISAPPGASDIPDWITHGAAYAILGGLVCRALSQDLTPRMPQMLACIALATLYGVSDECHQYFVPGRHCEASDVVKDFCGCVLGTWLWARVGALRPRHPALGD